MKVLVDIDIEKARTILETCAGSYEEMQQVSSMNDEQIKNLVVKHIKCWAVTEVKE